VKWLSALAVGLVGVALALVLIRLLNPLPSLEKRPGSRAYRNTDSTPLGRTVAPLAAAHRGLSGIHPLDDAPEAFEVRASLARAATRSIDAQYYIWHQDLTGSLLFNELRVAADRGVRVRLLLDDNNTSGLDPVIAALDAHPNIEVRLFNPFTIRRLRLIGFLTDFRRLNRRMHNKSFTVDNQATVVGGRNIGDEYFGAGSGALFLDLDVLAVGPVVSQVSEDFDRYWASASAFPADRIVPAISDARIAQIRRHLAGAAGTAGRAYLEKASRISVADLLAEGRLAFHWSPVRMISDDPAKALGRASPDDLLFSKLTASMGAPERSLDLVSGYFVPAKAGTRALVAMAKRGVQVTVLTNAFEATDVPIVHAGYAKRRRALLGSGVRLYELRGSDAAPRPQRDGSGGGASGSRLSGAGAALHAKTFLVDGRRLFVGSFNFDPRSANLNTELGFVIEKPALAEGMRAKLHRSAPARAYEVRLSPGGDLYWLERTGGKTVRHGTEPGTTRSQRAAVRLLSLLPIEWLL
jgi:cardiolipin synthase C